MWKKNTHTKKRKKKNLNQGGGKKRNKKVLIDETKHRKERWSEERGGMGAEM
jgi:hypothetical protein